MPAWENIQDDQQKWEFLHFQIRGITLKLSNYAEWKWKSVYDKKNAKHYIVK